MNIIEDKLNIFYRFFQKFLISILKSSSINSSASSLIMISMLSLFEYITMCSQLASLEEMKSIVIVN